MAKKALGKMLAITLRHTPKYLTQDTYFLAKEVKEDTDSIVLIDAVIVCEDMGSYDYAKHKVERLDEEVSHEINSKELEDYFVNKELGFSKKIYMVESKKPINIYEDEEELVGKEKIEADLERVSARERYIERDEEPKFEHQRPIESEEEYGVSETDFDKYIALAKEQKAKEQVVEEDKEVCQEVKLDLKEAKRQETKENLKSKYKDYYPK